MPSASTHPVLLSGISAPSGVGIAADPTASPAIAQAVRLQRRNRFNPLTNLTAVSLTRALEGFAAGDLREAAILWNTIAERDDTLPGVKSKREGSLANRRLETIELAKGDEAAAHKAVLEKFWEGARWINTWDRSDQGGVRKLIRRMQEAISYRYAAHHIVWQPQRDGTLRATFEFVPLWFFESREARLRFLPNGFGTTGVELDADEWLVSTGECLMIACSVGYYAKRASYAHWLRFSEKFSMPGVLGKTSAGQGTDEGAAMVAAVEAFGDDWSAVIYGADETTGIELIQANGNPNGMPSPPLIERIDRKFASLYRGADLSTMSSARDTAGTGASLQGDETDLLERSDAADRSEELQRVERTVIEWYFGRGVEPLARTEIVVPEREDLAGLLSAAKTFVDMGARISMADMLKRFSLTEAEAGERALGEKDGETRSGGDLEKDVAGNAFDPFQPRDADGRWAETGRTGKGTGAKRVPMRPGNEQDRKALKVAPGFTDLQVASEPGADLVATAKNAKGKTVYFYSEAYARSQAAAKFARIGALHRDIPALRAAVDADIAAGGPNAQRAMAVRMIMKTGLRNGGKDGGGKVETFGASSLLTSQVSTSGDRVTLDFVGKKGVRQRHSFFDPDIARHSRARQAAGKKTLWDHEADDTLAYLKSKTNDQYKVHDLRTWHGTTLANAAVAKISARGEAPKTEKEYKAAIKRVGKIVGRQLGNDGAMALKAYIHPEVFRSWTVTNLKKAA